MVLKQDYARDAVQAAQSVMLELARILGKYKNDIAIVGGWVPYLLLGDRGKQHIGSTDVDIALNHLTLQEVGYQSIAELLTAHDYVMGSQPFIFYRTLLVNGRELRVQVDLLAGEYEYVGAVHVARFEQITDEEERAICQQDAYQRVSYLLEQIEADQR
jgi:hypothetical protein